MIDTFLKLLKLVRDKSRENKEDLEDVFRSLVDPVFSDMLPFVDGVVP